MKKNQKFKFEILDVEEQNRFYDSRRTQNGGGYHQPLITFVFNGTTGYIDDSSCGDFGERIHIEYKDKCYSLDTIGEYDEYSSFSEECLEDKALAKHLNEAGYPISFKEELELADYGKY
jgi:hypothetical protein